MAIAGGGLVVVAEVETATGVVVREPVVVPSEEKSRQQMVSPVNGVAYLETAMMPFSLTRRALCSKMVPWRSASITGSRSALARTIVM